MLSNWLEFFSGYGPLLDFYCITINPLLEMGYKIVRVYNMFLKAYPLEAKTAPKN